MHFGLTILAGARGSNVTDCRRQNFFKIILGMSAGERAQGVRYADQSAHS
jgi:hypothetical protein